MLSPLKINSIPLLENLIASISPFAIANDVHIRFESNQDVAEVYHNPEAIIPDLTKVICRVITFTPQEYMVTLKVDNVNTSEDQFLLISIINSGVNLESLKRTILNGIDQNVSIIPIKHSCTKFVFNIPCNEPEEEEENLSDKSTEVERKYVVSDFYEKLKTHLTSHFTSIKNLEKATIMRSQKDGIFLKKVNAVILANLNNEKFDIASLSRAMALSRSQLYRRLKPLIRLAPINYIRYVRLQKAKESIENEHLTVGEAAFRAGFINLSHFSRAFRIQFGYNPSDLRRKQNIQDQKITDLN